MHEQDAQSRTLVAKADQRKFKATQQKQVLAQLQQQLGQLQAKVGSAEQQLRTKSEGLAQLQQELSAVKTTLKLRQNGNIMLNALMKGFRLKLEQEMANSKKALQ